MTTSWVKCCFERGRLGQRHRKGTKQLDERYGDIAISGPMDGGWNQVPSYPSEKRSTSVPLSRNSSSKRKKEQRLGVGHFHFKAHSGTQPFIRTEDTDYDERARRSHDKPPDFVYKPASEAFFKDMAEIGRSKYPPPSASIVDKHQRQISVQSTSSLEPTSPADIPCHPSYQRNMQASRGLSPPGLSTNIFHKSPVHTQYARECSPALSHRSIFDDHAYDTNEEEPEKQVQSPQLSMPKTKQKKSKRVVTEELVPSTTELFG
ncbi:predicted protein [Uncinocarpus reesii 1704]|uniref:Uncharacterized protein n=1 Tax=Uncinocarpus reesii (strain UAMH 1704) TaxID=336963 RepID=C4JHN4_UNCRE|nr:uncharacterized protein UREG_02720 [Uncinocarpus reesii 1704]EEP77871.1 predicted protein [Uncinocarpus reesii 1704]